MINIQEESAFLLNKLQIVAALETNIRYRIKETEAKDGTVTREVTVNDGRYDGDKREELNRLRKLLLKYQEENTQLGTENSSLQSENIKLFSESEKKDTELSEKDSIISAQQKEIEELRSTNAIVKDTEQAAQKKIIQTLRDQLQNEKRDTAQKEIEMKGLKQCLKSSTDKVIGHSRRKDELSSTVQQ